MAQLIQCDFCGNITNNIAAAITISISPEYRRNNRKVQTANGIVDIEDQIVRSDTMYGSQISKDCCSSCVSKFLDVKPVPLAITPSGEAVKSEDL